MTVDILDTKPESQLEVIPGSFMMLSHEPPPVADNISAHFNVDVRHTIFTFADVIHNPAGVEIDFDFIIHEELHAEQQGHTPEGAGRWWALYFQDPLFRIEQEAKAFAHQYDWWCANTRKIGGDRNWRAKKLHDLSLRLAAPTYGKVVNLEGAKKLIKGFSKTR